jgi:hypothetical protein
MRACRRRAFAAAALIAAAGTLAGCHGAAAPATTPSPAAHTLSTVSPTTLPRAATRARAKHTLPSCGAARDPFDPSATPPPPGSPARC